MDIKGFDFEHWWKLLAAAGTVIAAASIAVSNTPALIIGLGLLSAGIGEWINHPLQVRVGMGFKLTGHPRNANPFGSTLTVTGILLCAVGIVKLLLA